MSQRQITVNLGEVATSKDYASYIQHALFHLVDQDTRIEIIGSSDNGYYRLYARCERMAGGMGKDIPLPKLATELEDDAILPAGWVRSRLGVNLEKIMSDKPVQSPVPPANMPPQMRQRLCIHNIGERSISFFADRELAMSFRPYGRLEHPSDTGPNYYYLVIDGRYHMGEILSMFKYWEGQPPKDGGDE